MHINISHCKLINKRGKEKQSANTSFMFLKI